MKQTSIEELECFAERVAEEYTRHAVMELDLDDAPDEFKGIISCAAALQ